MADRRKRMLSEKSSKLDILNWNLCYDKVPSMSMCKELKLENSRINTNFLNGMRAADIECLEFFNVEAVGQNIVESFNNALKNLVNLKVFKFVSSDTMNLNVDTLNILSVLPHLDQVYIRGVYIPRDGYIDTISRCTGKIKRCTIENVCTY
jgi:hypothetical protein